MFEQAFVRGPRPPSLKNDFIGFDEFFLFRLSFFGLSFAGKTPEEAAERVRTNDLVNARLVEGSSFPPTMEVSSVT